MKNMLFILGVCCLFIRCNGPRPPVAAIGPARSFLAGTYVASESTDFCSVWDTLIITKDHSRDNAYIVSRTTTFQRSQGLTDFPEERASRKWYVIYNQLSHTAFSLDYDEVIVLIPNQYSLRLGYVTYYKIE